jgi:hypothetical protein
MNSLTNTPKRRAVPPFPLLLLAVVTLVYAMPGAVLGSPLPGRSTSVGVKRYVSRSQGNDSYDGLSPRYNGTHGPWKTLTRASETIFADGDQLLLKCGDTWNDGLELKGHGSPANPAVVSSYGAGPRPKIDRQDPSMANGKRCITLDGNAYGWRLANLELANGVNGVPARISEPGHSTLCMERLYIHG